MHGCLISKIQYDVSLDKLKMRIVVRGDVRNKEVWCEFCGPVKDAAWDCIEPCICVSYSFIHILKFLIWFPMDLLFQFSVSVP